MPTITHQCIPCRRTALITCVSNAGGLGPGHTCIVVDSFIYTFERVQGAWMNIGSG
jgi:hypothetical protein